MWGTFFIVATSVSLEIPTESHIIYLREDHGLPAYPPKIFSPLLITTRVGDFPSHLLWKLAGLNPSLVALYRIPHLASLGSSDIHDSRVFSSSKLVIIDDSLNTFGWLILLDDKIWLQRLVVLAVRPGSHQSRLTSHFEDNWVYAYQKTNEMLRVRSSLAGKQTRRELHK